jgi:RNA polymerase sigma-54 factor
VTTLNYQLVPTLRHTLSPALQLALSLLPLSEEALEALLVDKASENPFLRVQSEVRTRVNERRAPRPVYGIGDDPTRMLEQTVASQTTLQEHLREQIVESKLRGAECRFAALVLDSLDERGWLDLEDSPPETSNNPLTLDHLAAEAELPAREIERVLAVVRQFDPPGIASRNLRECLTAQAWEHDCSELEFAIIEHHLADLERGQFDSVLRSIVRDHPDATLDDARTALAVVRTLSTAPARTFAGHQTAVTERPIAAVREVHGQWTVTDLRNALCEIDHDAVAEARATHPKRVGDKEREARSILAALEHARSTQLRVVAVVTAAQAERMRNRAGAVRPFTMREVAAALGVHESTVSRTVSGRTIDTPAGVVTLRTLFCRGVLTRRGALCTIETVRAAVQELLANESADAPLTDEAIAKLLGEREGITVRRRTVTKYRIALGIASAYTRRAQQRA